MSPEQSRTHFPHLDGIRAIAALWVVLGHALVQAFPMIYGYYVSGRLAMWAGWLNYAHFGVDIFIVLSGFCLMLPVAAGAKPFALGKFFRSRARRILPPFYIALAISFVLDRTIISQRTGTIWDLCVPATGQSLLVNCFLMQDVFSYMSINSVFWTIAVEWKIYFLFPIILLGWNCIGPMPTTFLTIAIGYLAGFLFLHTALEGATVYYVSLFALGVFAAHIAVRSHPNRIRPHLPAMAFLISVVICSICYRMGVRWSTGHFIYLDGLAGAATAMLLVHLHAAGRLRGWIGCKPLAFVGTFSYSLYLVHLPLLQIAWVLFAMPFRITRNEAFFVMLGAVPATLCIAYVFFRLFERPFMSSDLKQAVDSERTAIVR